MRQTESERTVQLTPAQQQRLIDWFNRTFALPPPCAGCGGTNWAAQADTVTITLLDHATGKRTVVTVGQIVCQDCGHQMLVPAAPLGLNQP
jgi:hypothetical protein